ncbi:protein takeout-like [Tribolium madens]|uniref:protein takeout-like n=1 Tax=Tribolium madens TaxID=41895 RepID=UPI001CF73B6E|nr:protein takeout-like [Tribolium madens]
MRQILLPFLLSSVITLCQSAKLPTNFQKCNRKQPDLKQCVLKAAQDGIFQLTRPYNEVNIPNLNPFELKEATIGGGGAVAVEQKFKDCKLTGFNKMKLDKFEFDFEKKVLNVAGTFPEIVKKCSYEVDGQVLLLPVTGKGPSEIVLTNLAVTALLHYEETKKKNKTFIKIVSSEISMDPGHVSYKLDNLFNGDKVLGDNINQVLNDNWKEVFDDVKAGYIEIIQAIVTSLLNNFFSKVSIEEAFD